MSDEIKAALERWRSLKPAYRDAITDLMLLADAFADEHPADDEEPITPGWLRTLPDADVRGEVRCYFSLSPYTTRWLDVYLVDGLWHASIATGDKYAVDCDVVLLNNPTRGQLRRLLKELTS